MQVLPDAEVLQNKISKLLSPQYEYERERWIVALVFLTRLEGGCPRQVLVEQPQLIDFCCSLIEYEKTSSKILYARLVAQVIATSFCFLDVDTLNCAVLNPKINQLCQQLVQRLSQKPDRAISSLDADVLMAMTAWLPHCEDVDVIDTIVFHLWQCFESVIANASSASSSPQPVTTANQLNTPQEVMEATLTAILDQTSCWKSSDPAGNREWLETELSTLMVDQGRRCCCAATASVTTAARDGKNHDKMEMVTKTPLFLRPLLEWWLQKKRHAARKWPWVILLCLQNCGHSLPLSTDNDLAEKVLQLLLACMVFVASTATKASMTAQEEDDDNTGDALRAIAWSTMLRLVEAKGWEWILQVNNAPKASSSSLGRASKLCTILRMASGEWKIQLSYRLHTRGITHEPVSKDSCQSDNLVDLCGSFLAQSLEYVTHLADRDGDEEDSMSEDNHCEPLPSSAILHIRRSLQEALSCSAEYCSSMTEYREQDLVVVRLLSALLAEFDIFLEISSSTMSHKDEDHSILPAIRVLLNTLRNAEAQAILLPGLLMILASSEGDEGRLEVLKEYLCDFVGFFESWWSQVDECTSVESMESGWHVLELWHAMVLQTDVVVEIGGILHQISRFLSKMLAKKETRESKVNSISVAVSAFVTLQGGEPPVEPDASILQSAVAFLQTQGS